MSNKNKKLNSNEDEGGKSHTLTWFLLIVVGIVGVFVFLIMHGGGGAQVDSEGTAQIAEDGKQTLELRAKGGYSPSVITAQANKDSFLKVKTQNTFDCSSVIRIPSLNISKNLPANGETMIGIPAQAAGTQLKGTCGMGMYNFTIKFT